MVVETGMGGRLDATNIVDPVLSVITPIELEHTPVPGNKPRSHFRRKGGDHQAQASRGVIRTA